MVYGLKRNIINYILGITIAVSFVTAAIFFFIDQGSVYGIAFSGVGLIALLIFIIIGLISSNKIPPMPKEQAPAASEEERRRAEEVYKERVKQAIDIALGKEVEYQKLENITAVNFTGNLDKDVCMICKLFLKKKDSILQCPRCESLYHQNHLASWLKSKTNCPVCGQNLMQNQK